MLLLKSIPKSMIAEVAIKTSFSRLKAAKVKPLIAPPVPSKPAVIPDNAPPETELTSVGFSTNFLNIKSRRLIEIRKMESAMDKYVLSINRVRYAPRITKATAGIPI